MMKLVILVLALSALAVQGQEALAPSSSNTVLGVARSAGLTDLVEAATADDLEATLGNSSNPLSYTVFAPTNAAFAELLAATDTTLSALADTAELDDILQYHFLIEPYTVAQLLALGTDDTNFRNQTLSFEPAADGTVTVIGAQTNATIIRSNIRAGSSIVHVIDGVLVPDFTAPPTPTSSS